MIKVVQTPNPDETLRRLVHSVNFSETPLPFPCVTAPAVVAFGAPQTFGGMTFDRRVFRALLPDERLYVYAAGIVEPADANGCKIEIEYIPGVDGGVVGAAVLLGTETYVGAGVTKQALGPFDVYGTGGTSKADDVTVIQLKVTKLIGATTTVADWCLWARFLSSKQ